MSTYDDDCLYLKRLLIRSSFTLIKADLLSELSHFHWLVSKSVSTLQIRFLRSSPTQLMVVFFDISFSFSSS